MAAGPYKKYDATKYHQGNVIYDSRGNVVKDPIKLESSFGITPQTTYDPLATNASAAQPTIGPRVNRSAFVQNPRRIEASNTAAGMSNARQRQPGEQTKKKNQQQVNRVM